VLALQNEVGGLEELRDMKKELEGRREADKANLTAEATAHFKQHQTELHRRREESKTRLAATLSRRSNRGMPNLDDGEAIEAAIAAKKLQLVALLAGRDPEAAFKLFDKVTAARGPPLLWKRSGSDSSFCAGR
jgi:hypothetical protein